MESVLSFGVCLGSTAIHYAVDGGQENVVGHIVQNKLAVRQPKLDACAHECIFV